MDQHGTFWVEPIRRAVCWALLRNGRVIEPSCLPGTVSLRICHKLTTKQDQPFLHALPNPDPSVPKTLQHIRLNKFQASIWTVSNFSRANHQAIPHLSVPKNIWNPTSQPHDCVPNSTISWSVRSNYFKMGNISCSQSVPHFRIPTYNQYWEASHRQGVRWYLSHWEKSGSLISFKSLHLIETVAWIWKGRH